MDGLRQRNFLSLQMNLLDDPKKSWVIPPFFLILWFIAANIHDFIRFNYHDYFWVVGLIMSAAGILAIIFSIIYSIFSLRQLIKNRPKYGYFYLVMNLSPLLVILFSIIYRSIFN